MLLTEEYYLLVILINKYILTSENKHKIMSPIQEILFWTVSMFFIAVILDLMIVMCMNIMEIMELEVRGKSRLGLLFWYDNAFFNALVEWLYSENQL